MNTAVKLPFPTLIDNSMLESFSCFRKGSLEYLQSWKGKSESVHLVCGGAYASGLEALRRAFFFQGKSEAESLKDGIKAIIQAYGPFEPSPDYGKKNWLATIEALFLYCSDYPLANERYRPIHIGGQESVEFSFAIPLPINNPDTGEPLIYVGRADQIAEDQETSVRYLSDDKTSSELGATFSKKFELSSQFTGYTWAAREHGYKTNGTLVRAMCFYNDRQATTQFLTYRSEFEINQWYVKTIHVLENIIDAYKKNYFVPALDHRCNSYGICPFADYCKFGLPQILPENFEQKIWNPSTRTLVHIDDYVRNLEEGPTVKLLKEEMK